MRMLVVGWGGRQHTLMGKTPVYPHISSIKQDVNGAEIKAKSAGKQLALDASMWIHKVLGNKHAPDLLCSYVVLEDSALATQAYLARATTARDIGLDITHVFDGAANKHKEAEEAERATRRNKPLEDIQKLKQRQARQDEYPVDKLIAAARRTPAFQEQLMSALNKAGFKTMQSPQEADAQLAYLSLVDDQFWAVIVDDVDALVSVVHAPVLPQW